MRFSLFILSVAVLGSAFSVQAKTYKWTDEEGQVHFGDKIPSRYLVREHEELNEQGVVTRHRAAAKTAEEKAEERRIEREKKKAELAEKKKRQRDRVLLDTYTTERDLFIARDARLDAVDSQIQLAETIVNDSAKKVEEMDQQIADIKESGREVPHFLYKKINNEKAQVKVQTKVLHGHQKNRELISKQFNGYIERFKTLKAEEKARKEKYAQEWQQQW